MCFYEKGDDINGFKESRRKAELKETIEYKDEKINKLESALNKVKTELSKFKDFCCRRFGKKRNI